MSMDENQVFGTKKAAFQPLEVATKFKMSFRLSLAIGCAADRSPMFKAFCHGMLHFTHVPFSMTG